ncbi:MAG TPA: TerB family tellurite resistance protein [Myxococcales bacterium]|nr:TerB family tellurite resistance protein [Myxococcales bacterium]
MTAASRIYQLMVLTAFADGKVQPGEALAVQRIAASEPALAALGNRGELARGIRESIEKKGVEACIREAAAGLGQRPDQELAFRCCARVLHADGELAAEDAEALATLQETFGFSGADVQRLLAHL